MKSKVGIIGLGYVGLPLGMRFAECGHAVVGFEIDAAKAKSLGAGRSTIAHIPDEELGKCLATGRFQVECGFDRISECDAVLICVPTPLGQHLDPDLQFVVAAGEAIGPRLRKGQLIVLESTTYPGTTDGVLREVLEKASKLKAGTDFHLAYSPEREDPGNADSGLSRIPKVVGGMTDVCTQKAAALYQGIAASVVPVANARVAEAGKLLENIFRCVNIALVNELKVVYSAMGIDVWEVIEAAKSKPFGFMPFYPGPGLGGHCIPIDPFYLTWKAREYGQHTRFIELAGEINNSMPRFVVNRVQKALNQAGKPVRGARILVLGVAYKPDVDDMRESPAFPIMSMLAEEGAQVSFHDPFVPAIPNDPHFGDWCGHESIPWTRETISGFDLALIVTNHKKCDYRSLGEWSRQIVDTRNVMSRLPEFAAKVWKA
jgi:UDP-N-acetyl-D-glucosamine dehydrogenase